MRIRNQDEEFGFGNQVGSAPPPAPAQVGQFQPSQPLQDPLVRRPRGPLQEQPTFGRAPAPPPDVTGIPAGITPYAQPLQEGPAWSPSGPPAPPPPGYNGGGGGGTTPGGPLSGGGYGSGGSSGGGGGGYDTFNISPYDGPMSPTYRPIPELNFTPPPGFEPPGWQAPNADTFQNDPGYQFRLQQGMDALQNSAAARGSLLTGGTLKDLINYGQNFGSQEYGSVFDRQLRGYGANYQAAKDRYDTTYQTAKDQFAPRFADWQMTANTERERAMAEFNRRYETYALGVNAQLAKEGYLNNALMTPYPQFPGTAA